MVQVSITELDYKNLNKNDIEDMYLLIVNDKVDDYAKTGLLWSLVLEGLKSYNNNVKHGYVTPSLSKEDVEYLQLFEEEIEEWLKHHDQMRRWQVLFNNHTGRNNEKAIHKERKPNDDHGIRKFDNDLVWNNAPCHANEEEDQYREDRCELLENPCQEPPVCKIGSFEVIKYSFGPTEKYIAIKECVLVLGIDRVRTSPLTDLTE
ncbi:hypothetical protein Tco_0810986 [Tanacetum coccineum]